MNSKAAWFLAGAAATLLLVIVSTGTVLGFTLLGLRSAERRAEVSPRPSPVVIATPSPSPSGAVVVPTPSPNPFAGQFRELAIPKPGGTPYALVVMSDGSVWFTEAECTSGIGRYSPKTGWQHWSITGNCESQPLAITRGSDGNMWFADVWSSYGRITPGGEITRFKTQQPSYPSGITTGPDGKLWLAASSPQSRPYIARIDTDGSEMGEFALPDGEQPRGIVTGPDGAIWFTENAGIGRLTVGGDLKQFPLPQGNGSGMPYQIAVGPDHNLWFIEYMPEGDGRIGRLTASGRLTEFATPGVGGLQWIAAGPDGAMWFTGSHSNNIARIDMSGAVTSYPVPSLRSQPTGIAAGPDGTVWFAEQPGDGTGKLGVFTVQT